MRHLFAALALVTGAVAIPPKPAELRGADLMQALRAGGYTVLLRHGRTDHTFQEAVTPIPTERYEQRNLSDDGVKDARVMGKAFRKYGITFGEILASPMYRAKETAEYAAGKPTLTMVLRAFPSTPEQAALVAAPVPAGTNRLLVTHHFVIETHVPGIKPGDIDESEAAVVRPVAGGKVELVGKIKLADWAVLAGDDAETATTSRTYVTHGGAGARATMPDGLAANLPNTPIGHLTLAYVQAFSSGDSATMKSYIETYLDSDPNRPTKARLESYARLFEQHGPLTLVGVESSLASEVSAWVRGKAGPLKLTIKASPTNAMRVSSVTFTMTQTTPP